MSLPVSDNPLVFTDSKVVLSGGNFHAEPVALAADYLALAIAEIGALSERRIEVDFLQRLRAPARNRSPDRVLKRWRRRESNPRPKPLSENLYVRSLR